MVRFLLSLALAAGLSVSGYGALGAIAGATPAPALKTIAVVVVHAHCKSAVSRLPAQGSTSVVQ